MVNREELELVSKDLEAGNELTYEHIGRVFGSDAWKLLVYMLLDANDAARAVQGAIYRLKAEK